MFRGKIFGIYLSIKKLKYRLYIGLIGKYLLFCVNIINILLLKLEMWLWVREVKIVYLWIVRL